jgi:hypothetical protein
LSRVITGVESSVYGYDREQQSSQLTESKVKIMLIILFDMKGIVHKEFAVAGQTVNFA